MSEEKVSKNLCVRFPEKFHREIKLQAYKEGKTIQDFVFDAVKERVQVFKKQQFKKMCQACGGWSLAETSMAKLGKCELCNADDVPVFACKEER